MAENPPFIKGEAVTSGIHFKNVGPFPKTEQEYDNAEPCPFPPTGQVLSVSPSGNLACAECDKCK